MTSQTLTATVLLAVVVASATTPIAAPANAEAAYERLKALEGSWDGTSSKGWTDQLTFKTIAAGSAVIETSFDAHPGETMVTVFVLDGNRLLLTHYCVARNQPRLVATTIADGGRRVTFTFLDATNLSSRDRGHMDKATFDFVDDDHFTTRWTWYQDGKESWMEEIRMTRRRAEN
jgi:GH24 family phage-related lysozyme (muramidase)